MQVYAGFECWRGEAYTVRHLQKVFKEELDALRWVEQKPDDIDREFRFYQPVELE